MGQGDFDYNYMEILQTDLPPYSYKNLNHDKPHVDLHHKEVGIEKLQLRHNCTYIADFHYQSQILKKRFIEKGYRPADLDVDIYRTSIMDRNTLLTDHPKPIQEHKHKWSYFSTFSIQHRQIKENFKKHWFSRVIDIWVQLLYS